MAKKENVVLPKEYLDSFVDDAKNVETYVSGKYSESLDYYFFEPVNGDTVISLEKNKCFVDSLFK